MISIRKIGAMGRTYRHAKRYGEILNVLIKYGFGDLVDVLNIKQHIEIGIEKITGKEPERIAKLSRPERVRMTLEELGPTFVKLGQLLSTRPDLIPLEYVQELSELQDNVPAFPYDEVRAAVKAETGRFPEEIFGSFDQRPIAAASLGQVHKAILKHTEEVVAVKVQRPNIQQTIEVDLGIMLHLASLMERHVTEIEAFHPTQAVNEFARSIEEELDYTLEASHIEHFARQFLDDETVYIPMVYRYLSTQRFLVMEFIDGIKASALDRLKQDRYDLQEIASRGADSILKQISVFGFYHADSHPGNIFILPNNVICFIDFGMMGRIGQQEREDFTDFVELLINKDENKIVDALLKLTNYAEDPNRSELQRDLMEFIDRYAYLPLKKLEIARMLQSVLEILTKQGMSLKPDLYLMIKALSIAEGLGRSLDPEFEIVNHAKPFFRNIKASRYTPKRIARDLVDSGTELLRLFKEIPGEVREVLKNVRDGKLKIEIEYRALDRTLYRLDLISDRIASAIVLASLIVGSSIIILSKTPPTWHDMPVIGLVGFLIAAVWGLTSILRSGKALKDH
ncbi:MAG: AarF/ABC1/UbiB kinase family protein [Terriglobia bacterium]